MSKRAYKKRGASQEPLPVSADAMQCPTSRRCPPDAIRRLTNWTTRYFRCSILHKGCGEEWWINGDGVPMSMTGAQVDFVERV